VLWIVNPGVNFPFDHSIPAVKGIIAKLTIRFWMCQKCGKMKDYNKIIIKSAVE
jgi:hypothetical protein